MKTNEYHKRDLIVMRGCAFIAALGAILVAAGVIK